MASWQAYLASWAVRAQFKGLPMRPRRMTTVEDVRARMDGGPRAKVRGVRVEPGAVGGVAGEWIAPAGDSGDVVGDRRGPVLLYLHGGGYMACSAATHRPVTAALERRLGAADARARTFAPDYRLAPEHPYPAALDDALAVVRGLYASGVSPVRLVLAGDSAGGGLALSTLVALRDAGDPLPAAAALFSPWTDLAVTGASVDENDRRCAMFTASGLRRGPAAYLGEADPRTPTASPLYADFTGLPPLLMHASRAEVLRDDAVRTAERARAAGVDVDLALYDRVPHVWQFWDGVVPEATASLDAAAAFLLRHAGRRPPREIDSTAGAPA